MEAPKDDAGKITEPTAADRYGVPAPDGPAASAGSATNAGKGAALDLGSVLRRSFAALKQNPTVFLGLAVLAVLPSLIVSMILLSDSVSALVGRIFDLIFGLLMQGATAYSVYQLLRGRVVSLREAIIRGMDRIGPLVLAALLMGILTSLGFALFIIPGLILTCLFAVTIPTCVVERTGPLKSMERSANLTQGHRMTIFFLYVIVYAVILVVAFVVGAVVGGVFHSEMLAGVLVFLLLLVPQAFLNIMAPIIYYDLRAIKEGVTIDSLVNVFD